MRFVHLAALWALAFVQPLFDRARRRTPPSSSPATTRPGDILIFAFGWTLVPPLLAYATRARSSGGRALLTFIGAVLQRRSPCSSSGPERAGAVAHPARRSRSAPRRPRVRARGAGCGRSSSILGVAPLVVLALLLVFSPVERRGLPRRRRPATAGAARSSDPTPVVLLVFDELPTTTLMTADKHDRRRALPELRRPRRALHLVPQRDERRPTAPTSPCRRSSPACARRPSCRPRTCIRRTSSPCSAATTSTTRRSRSRASARRGCAARGPRRARASGCATSPSDLSVVERRLLLPDDLADDLPGRRPGLRGLPGRRPGRGGRRGRRRDSPAGKPIRVAGDDLPAQRVRAAREVVRRWTRRTRPVDGPLRRPARAVALPARRQPVPRARARVPGPRRHDVGDDEFLLDPGRAAPRADDALRRHAARRGDRPDARVGPVGRRAGDRHRRPRRQHQRGRAAAQRRARRTSPRSPASRSSSSARADAGRASATATSPRWTSSRRSSRSSRSRRTGSSTASRSTSRATPSCSSSATAARPRSSARRPRSVRARFDAALAERAERLPAGLAGPTRARASDLVGRPLTELDARGSERRRGFLNNAPLYEDGAAQLGGAARLRHRGDHRVAAPAPTCRRRQRAHRGLGRGLRRPRRPRFSMLVRPAALRRGANRIEVLAVDGETARLLAPRADDGCYSPPSPRRAVRALVAPSSMESLRRT